MSRDRAEELGGSGAHNGVAFMYLRERLSSVFIKSHRQGTRFDNPGKRHFCLFLIPSGL